MEELQDPIVSEKIEKAIHAGYIDLDRDKKRRVRWLLSIVSEEDPFEAILYAYDNEEPGRPKFFMPFKSFVEDLVGQQDSAVVRKAREAALKLFDSALNDMTKSVEEKIRSTTIAEAEKALAERNREIDERSNALERQRAELDATSRRVAPSRSVNWLYICLVLLCVLVTGLAIFEGWAKEAEVAIEYNVGEIIGGILAGGGVAAAGGAYALRTLREVEAGPR